VGAERAPIRVRVAGSVRFRLTVTVVLVVGLSLLGGGALLVNWVEATLVNDLRTRNQQLLASIAESLRQGGPIPAELQFVPPEVPGEDPDTGNGIFGSPANSGPVISDTEVYLEVAGVNDLKVTGVSEEGRLMVAPRQGPSLPSGDESIDVRRQVATRWGILTLHAVAPVAEIRRSVGTLTGALWLGLPVLAIGAGVMTWLITGRALAPVGLMTRRVRELTAASLDARVPEPATDDEIAELARTMNGMLDRLERASQLQRQFVSDASHELRSPVASIRAQLETALRFPEDVDWTSVARIVLEEDRRLEHLVENLLVMARLEEGRGGPRSDVDLDDLVMRQTPRMTGVDLDLSGVSAGRVWGNPDELTSVVRNLLDNAARHAGSIVRLTVRDEGPWVVMTVSDDGPGIPEDQRQVVFERFARLQEGRERDRGGTGLGLALSRRIVEQHGGRIRVDEASDGGACFVVSLPASGWTGRKDDAETGESSSMSVDRAGASSFRTPPGTPGIPASPANPAAPDDPAVAAVPGGRGGLQPGPGASGGLQPGPGSSPG
jgi:signal transduction histidine kinase